MKNQGNISYITPYPTHPYHTFGR